MSTSTGITQVKIDKDRQFDGWYILRSQETAILPVSTSRTSLRGIADREGWAVVKSWS